MTAEPLGVGLIGFGMAARTFHAPLVQATPGLLLRGIVQRQGVAAQESYPQVRVAASADDLLRDDSIRLVVIATPNESHFPLAQQCLEAGRHVVVDKPFTTTGEEAEALCQVAESRRLVLSVFHNRRWDNDFLTVQHLLRHGTLGRVVSLESAYDRYRPARREGAWREQARSGSGILFDLGSHLADQALLLFGWPEKVTADVRRERDAAVVDDAFDVVLHYPRLRVVLRASMLAAAPAPRFQVRGTQGSYVKHGLDPQEEALKAGKLPGSPDWGQERKDYWGMLTTAEGTQLKREPLPSIPGDYGQFYRNVRDAIQGAAPLAVTAAQARDVVRLLEWISHSQR